MPVSVFDRLWSRLHRSGHEIAPLHIGDICTPPPAASRLGALGFGTGDEPDLYRYAAPAGRGDLIEAIARKARSVNQLTWCEPGHVQVTAGATHALSIALRTVADQGDELLVLSPYWPLIRGIARSHGVTPVEVPFSQRLYEEPGSDIEALIEPFVTARTAAIYFATPNNPDGKVLGRHELAGIAEVARRHDLWVLADEVYEHHLYDGREHASIGALPGMADRTATVFSCSKSFGQAGLRVGYVIASREVTTSCRALTTHTIYSVPAAMQRAALAALEHGGEFVTQARRSCLAARDQALSSLVAPARVPEGSTYLFVDLRGFARAGEPDAIGVLERLADVGVLLAPGAMFGAAWNGFARLCFTAVGAEPLARAIARANQVLGS